MGSMVLAVKSLQRGHTATAPIRVPSAAYTALATTYTSMPASVVAGMTLPLKATLLPLKMALL